MKTTALVITALLALGSTQASAQNPFGNFMALQQTIQCFRKPGTDYLYCTNKPVDYQEDADTTPEPVPTPLPVGAKYEIIFSVGAGGKIVDAVSGFECESQCEIELEEGLRTTYDVIPDRNYQFAGWSGDICNTPNTYDNPGCEVSVNSDLHIKAEFSRIADLDAAGTTEEFEVSSYGFGSYYTEELAPVICYPHFG